LACLRLGGRQLIGTPGDQLWQQLRSRQVCHETRRKKKQHRAKLTSNAATSGGRSAVTSREEGRAVVRWVLGPSAAGFIPSAPGSDHDSNRRSSAAISWLSSRSSFSNSSNLTTSQTPSQHQQQRNCNKC